MLVLVIGDLHLPHRASDLPSKFRKLLVPGKIQQIVCTGNVCDRETLDYLRTVAGDVHVVRGDWDENPYFPNSLVIHHPPLRIGVLHGHQIVPPGDVDSQCSLARAMDVDVLVTGNTHRFDAFEREGRFFVNPGSATGAWSSVWPIRADGDEEQEEENKQAPDVKERQEDKEAPVDTAEALNKKVAQKEGGEAKEDKDANSTTSKDEKSKKDESSDKATDDKAKEKDKEKATQREPKPAPEPTPSFALLDIQGAVIVTYVYQLIDNEVKVEKMEFRKAIETDANGNEVVTAEAGARRPVASMQY